VKPRRRCRIVNFEYPFRSAGVEQMLPPDGYRIVADRELIDGMFYGPVSTAILLPGQSSQTGGQAVIIDPFDLESAIDRDADLIAKPNRKPSASHAVEFSESKPLV
jgi:hypothetical protein